MSKWRKKPVVIEAVQWFKNGDHPLDYANTVSSFDDHTGGYFEIPGEHARVYGWEGQVVRYYRAPDDDGERACEKCGKTMHEHGWIELGWQAREGRCLVGAQTPWSHIRPR